MDPAPFHKFAGFPHDLGQRRHDFVRHIFKVMLTNSEPARRNRVVTDIAEVPPVNGYIAGGKTIPNVRWTENDGVALLAGDDVVFTAAGGTLGPYRYGVLANGVTNYLIGWWDYGRSRTVNDGDKLLVEIRDILDVM